MNVCSVKEKRKRCGYREKGKLIENTKVKKEER